MHKEKKLAFINLSMTILVSGLSPHIFRMNSDYSTSPTMEASDLPLEP